MPFKYALLAAILAPAMALAQGGTTINNANDNENNVDVGINIGGGGLAPAPPASSPIPSPPSRNATSMTLSTTVVTAYSTYCPSPTVLFVDKERYVITKPTMVTFINCPCTITTKVPVHTPVAPVYPIVPVIPSYSPVAPVVRPVTPVGTVSRQPYTPPAETAVRPAATPVAPARPVVTAGAAAVGAENARRLFGLAVAVGGAAAIGALAP